jgi:hypothetical protein
VSDTIIMRHPTLPDRQEIEVPKDAMPHYTGAGWQPVPAEELQARADLKAREMAEAAEEEARTADQPEQSEPAESTDERPARSRTKTAAKKTEEES